MTTARDVLNTVESFYDDEIEAKRNIERVKKALKKGKTDPQTAKEMIDYWKGELERIKTFQGKTIAGQHTLSNRPDAILRKKR